MGNNSMRAHIRRSNKEKARPSRQICPVCQSCGNRHADRLASAPRVVNHTQRITTAPRTAAERAASQSRSWVPSATGAGISALRRPKQSRPRRQRPQEIRTPVHTPRRRHRTRPRSKLNTQSGGPVGGDLAVPGDQSTSPQPPQEIHDQTLNTAAETSEVVPLDVCLPQTPPLCTSCSTCPATHISSSNSCQPAVPTRWKFVRKNVQKLRESQISLIECSLTNTGSSVRRSEISGGVDVAGPSGCSAADTDTVIPPMPTGFYFGTSKRQSWPHTVASAEYFTVVSTRRMKKVEPSLYSDQMTTTFEVDEEDMEERNRTAMGEEDDDEAAKAAAAAFLGSDRSKLSSQQRQNIRRARRTRSTTVSQTCKTGRLRREKSPKARSTHLRASLVHDVLRKILFVGQRRNEKHTNKKADSHRSSTNDDRTRSPEEFTSPTVRTRSSESRTFSPTSCSARSTSQEDNPNRRNPCLHPPKTEDKQLESHRDSRESQSSSYKNVGGYPSTHPRRTSQQENAELVQPRRYPCVPRRRSKSKTLPRNSQKTHSSFTPKREFSSAKKSPTLGTRRSMSFQEPEGFTFGTNYCTKTNASANRNSSYLVEEAHRTGTIKKRNHSSTRLETTNLKKTVMNTSYMDDGSQGYGTGVFDRCDEMQIALEGSNNSPNFISSKLGSCGTHNAQLFLNHVLHNPASSLQNLPHNDKSVRMSQCYIPQVVPDVTAQNVDDASLASYLVKSSVGVQNAVFPHLNTAERVSKTTQITPEGLADAWDNDFEGSVLKSDTFNMKETIYVTQKCMKLPLHTSAIPLHTKAIPSTSRRKTRKTVRIRNKVNVSPKNRRPAKYKFVRTAPNSEQKTPPSAKRRIQPPPESTNSDKRHKVGKARPTTGLRAIPKPMKKVTVHSPRNINASKSSTSLSETKQKTYRTFRVKHTEDSSRSELVSLFRANTRGSSIQSVGMDSSNSMFGMKPTSFLEQGKRLKVTPPKSRTIAKWSGKMNTSPESKPGSPGLTKRIERNKRPSLKSPGEAGPERGISRPPRDTIPTHFSHEPCTSETKMPIPKLTNDSRLETSTLKALSDSCQKKHTSPCDLVPFVIPSRSPPNAVPAELPQRPQSDTVPTVLPLRPPSKSVPAALPSRPSCDALSVAISPRLPTDPAATKKNASRLRENIAPKTRRLKAASVAAPKTYSPRPICSPNIKSYKPPHDLSTRTLSPKLPSDSEPKVCTPKLPNSKTMTHFYKLSSDSGPSTLSDPDTRKNAKKLQTQSAPRTPVQKTNAHSKTINENVPPKARQPVEMERIPSPKFDAYSTHASKSISKKKETDPSSEIYRDTKIQTHLVISTSSTGSSRGISYNQTLTPTGIPNEVFSNHLRLQLNPNCFRLELDDKAKYFEHSVVLDTSRLSCSCRIHDRRSISATSMIPAVGSYEDKVLFSNSWQKYDHYSHNTLWAEEGLSSKGEPEPQSTPENVQSLTGPPSESPKETSSGTDSPENSHNTSPGGGSSRTYSHSIHQNEDMKHHLQIDGSTGEAAPRDHDNENIRKRSAGVQCQSDIVNTTSRNTATERSQLELCCGLVENQRLHEIQRDDELLADRSQESMSTGLLLPPQTNESDYHKDYSAASMALSVLERPSSQDATRSCCQISTQSDIASNLKEASQDISSLTDAISCISSIPEDTLPIEANSNSTTHQILLEELCSNNSKEETKEFNYCSTHDYSYYDTSSWLSVPHQRSSKEEPHRSQNTSEPKQIDVSERPYAVEIVELNSAPNESCKKCHERSSAALHVSWDTSSAFCTYSKCSRCGAHRKEGIKMSQSVVSSWHDPHIQEDNFYASSNTYNNWHQCGRCTTCLREKCHDNERWSQLSSSTIPSTPRAHVNRCRLDQATNNTTNLSKNDFSIPYPITTSSEIPQNDPLELPDTQTGVFGTLTHPFSCTNFHQAPPRCSAHIIPATAQAATTWTALPPYSKSPPFMITPCTNSAKTHEMTNNVHSDYNNQVEPSRLAVASFWPTMVPTPDSRSAVDNLTVNTTEPFQMKSTCRHNPRLTLSPVYTTSLPDDVVSARTSPSFNKDIVLQRIADLLDNRSSVLSIDSYNKVRLVLRVSTVNSSRCAGLSTTSYTLLVVASLGAIFILSR